MAPVLRERKEDEAALCGDTLFITRPGREQFQQITVERAMRAGAQAQRE